MKLQHTWDSITLWVRDTLRILHLQAHTRGGGGGGGVQGWNQRPSLQVMTHSPLNLPIKALNASENVESERMNLSSVTEINIYSSWIESQIKNH